MLKYICVALIALCCSVCSHAQTVSLVQDLVASNQGNSTMKLDQTGNIYLYNSQFTTALSDVVKLDKSGNQLWSIKITNILSGTYYMPLYIDVDSAQNVYGVTFAYNNTGTQIQTSSGTTTINGPHDGEQLIVFKLDKNGALLWTDTIECYSATLAGITYDKYTDAVYPLASYAMDLTSDAGDLTTPAIDNPDLAPVAFFWSVNGSSGKNIAIKNLYLGEPGTIVPLPDRLAYCTSSWFTTTGNGSYLQLDRTGTITQTKSISLLQPSIYSTPSVTPAYFYDTGVTSDESIITFYDFRNRIRKIDLYGNTAIEKDFDVFDTVSQQKQQVFTLTHIRAINDKNTLLLGINLNTYSTYYLGDSLAANEFHFTFMDENFKVNKDIKCLASQYVVPIGMEYSYADSTVCVLMKGNYADNLHIGNAAVIHFNKPQNVYTYLVKIKFSNVPLINDQQPAITSLLLNQQVSAATINDSLATANGIVPASADLTSLSPVITLSPNTKFETPLTLPADFRKPVTVTLINGSGVKQDWQIIITKSGADNNIDTLSFNNQLSYIKDTVKKTINVLVDWPVDISNTHFALFKSAAYTTVSPDPNSITDFSAPQTFNITAPDGTSALWTVTVTRRPNAANDILSLTFAGELDSAHINDINKIVTVHPKAIQATLQSITLSPGAALVSPLSQTVDFSGVVTFNVKAENGDIASWLIQPISGPFSGLDGVIKVYPVPANNSLNVMFNAQTKVSSLLNITSVYGQKMLSAPISFNNTPVANFDVSKLQNGVYLLSITNEGHSYAIKITVQH